MVKPRSPSTKPGRKRTADRRGDASSPDPRSYTAEELTALIDFVLALRKSHVQAFLQELELPKSGTKSELRDRIQSALEERALTAERLIEFLDRVSPWGKQHVFLFTGPRGDIGQWKSTDSVLQRLQKQNCGHLLNASLPLALPPKLTLSSIQHNRERLRVTAIQKSEYWERVEALDETRTTENGGKVVLRAYVQHVSRTLVALEWDLIANVAMLQITQLKTDMQYDEVATMFFELVGGWLDRTMFAPVDLRPSIKRLQGLVKGDRAEVRDHGVVFRTMQGSLLSATSASPRHSVVADDDIEAPLADVAKKGVGHLGNFYWLASANGNPGPNPLEADVHVFIVGSKGRINFPTPNTEEVVRYVLQRVRALSGRAS